VDRLAQLVVIHGTARQRTKGTNGLGILDPARRLGAAAATGQASCQRRWERQAGATAQHREGHEGSLRHNWTKFRWKL
jgi:hypothetical protein